jgi:uncharacterized membrane protein
MCINICAAVVMSGVAHFTEEQGFKDMYPHQVTLQPAAGGVCSLNTAAALAAKSLNSS